MSAFYDQASLVVVPSGYKSGKIYAQKPLTTDGQLTFTRASNATRVASNGIIEKVRTNLILQSNTFSTTWTNNNSTETGGQAGYDGTNNAWLLQATNTAQARLTQTQTTNGLQTFSVYAKAGTSNFLILEKPNTGSYIAWFNLSNGTLGTALGGTATITSVGNGWYRCTINGTPSASADVRIYVATGDGSSAVTIGGNIYIQNAQLEEGDIATDYIATTTAAVSVGPVSGLPRLDYLNSTCPRLILEPQRTNVFLNSESASAQPITGTVTISSNSAVSPSGYADADQITADSTGYLRPTLTVTTGTNFVWSVFLKNVNSGGSILFARRLATAIQVNISWSGSVPTASVASGTGTVKVVNYGNDWYRFEIATTSVEDLQNLRIYPSNGASASVLFWGGQVETSATYATSYIPTLSTSVTRVGSAVYKGSISSLIGATEGVLFVDFIKPPTASTRTKIARAAALLTDGGNSYLQSINLDLETNGNLRGNIVNTTSQVDIQTAAYAAGTRIKMAFAYKANDCVLYINGTQIGTDTSCTIPVCTAYEIGSYETVNTTQTNYVSQALLFKTRLTNAQLAELTTL